MKLTEEDKKALLNIVRSTIERKLTAGIDYSNARETIETSPALKEKSGVFVTLKKKGQLRGCIGYIQAFMPLEQAVAKMALAAAFDDPRFPPLKRNELKEISVEISILSPLKRISKLDEIEVGKHGLYIMRGYSSGLLLPQVATEYDWDRLTFLEQTCCKAGLPCDAWKDEDSAVFVFSADIIEESEATLNAK
jgi:AmmeMemoRadiSam system protein A